MTTLQLILENDIRNELIRFRLSNFDTQNLIINYLLVLLFRYTFLKHPIQEYFIIFIYWFVLIGIFVGVKVLYYMKRFYMYIRKGWKN